MEPENLRQSSPRPRIRPGRRAAQASLAAVLTMGTVTSLIGAPIAGAQEPAPATAPSDISVLVRAVADATAKLDVARQDIAVKREGINKTLVDLQIARIELDRAISESEQASADREQAEVGVQKAQQTIQDYSRLLYRQGSAPGAASALIAPGGPADSNQRQEYLRRAAADQQLVVERMQTARQQAGEREVVATTARESADRRYTEALSQRDSAEAGIRETTDQVNELEKQVTDLTSQLQTSQDKLASVGGQGPVAPANLEQYAGRNSDIALRNEALSRLLGRTDISSLANAVAGALPAHLNLGAIRNLGGGSVSGSSERAARAVGGTVSAGSVQSAVENAAAGDTDALVQQVIDAISRSDMGSSQGPQSPTTTAPATTSAGAPTTPKPPTGTPSPGGTNSSAKARTVIDRAMSQLGVTYAWGGGDANGPTRGIRDGGVADSYGDYNKIGFDCSGLMIYAFAGIGKALPHYTGYQYTSGRQVPVSERQPGDMLFWDGHVALYMGDGKMIESPASGDMVKISPVRLGGIWPYAVRLTD